MTLWLAAVLGVAILAIAAFVAHRSGAKRRLPTAVAEQRLRSQLGEVQGQLAIGLGPDPVESAVRRLRGEWFAARLHNTPIESLKIGRIGAATYDLLREYGIRNVSDLPQIRGLQIRSLGNAKKAALLGAYDDYYASLDREAHGLSWEIFDQMSNGEIARLQAARTRQQRERARERDALLTRQHELERRLRDVPS